MQGYTLRFEVSLRSAMNLDFSSLSHTTLITRYLSACIAQELSHGFHAAKKLLKNLAEYLQVIKDWDSLVSSLFPL